MTDQTNQETIATLERRLEDNLYIYDTIHLEYDKRIYSRIITRLANDYFALTNKYYVRKERV